MPTTVVDLGYFSPYWNQYDNGQTISPLQSEVSAKEVYDRVKLALEAINEGNDWGVGRLIEWMGAENDFGFGFVIYHLDGAGSPTGREWFITWGGRSDTQDDFWPAAIEVWENAAHWDSHFKAYGTTNSSGFQAIHYHKGGLLGSTYDVNESLGNLVPPATNPYIDADAFMPTFATRAFPRGVSQHGQPIFDGNGIKNPMWCLVANQDVPFVGIYTNWYNNRHVRVIMLTGDIIVPRAAGDVYPEGVFRTAPADHFAHGTTAVQVLSAAGAQEEVTTLPTTSQFNEFNQPRADGEYDRDPIPLGSDKGFLDEEVIATQGWHNSHRNKVFTSAHGCAIKLDEYHVYPWTLDTLPAFVGWPLNPQPMAVDEARPDAVLLETLRADTGLGLGDGAPVVTWNGSLVTWTATGAITFRASAAVNGLPSVEINPIQYLDEDGSLGVLNQPTTYVFRLEFITGAAQVLFDGTGLHGAAGQRQHFFAVAGGGNVWQIYAGLTRSFTPSVVSGIFTIIVCFNGKNSFLDINGTRYELGTNSTPYERPMELMRIGANSTAATGMDAYLQEMQVWRGRMTEAQISAVQAQLLTDWPNT